MFGLSSISASVRLTFNIRSYARADNPNLVIAFSSNPFDSASIAQYFRINRCHLGTKDSLAGKAIQLHAASANYSFADVRRTNSLRGAELV